MDFLNRYRVLGVKRFVNHVNRNTGETYDGLNIAVAISDPEYAGGVRAATFFVKVVDLSRYDFVKPGARIFFELGSYNGREYIKGDIFNLDVEA